jgi:anti-sigma factor RsiW
MSNDLPREDLDEDLDEGLDEEISAMIDGELGAEREAALRERLAGDPQLVARLAALERVDAALVALPAEEPSLELRESLRTRIGAEPARARPRRRVRRAWAGAAFAASLAMYWIVSGSGSSTSPVTEEPTDVLASDLSGASDEEIGIALDYEILADLEVIEDLEILEFMIELEDASRG